MRMETKLTIIICILILLLGLGQAAQAEDTPTATTPDLRDVFVHSFYDTQLDVVCYVATSGLYCMSSLSLTNSAKMFVDDRVTKAKDGIKVPRIVPLD